MFESTLIASMSCVSQPPPLLPITADRGDEQEKSLKGLRTSCACPFHLMSLPLRPTSILECLTVLKPLSHICLSTKINAPGAKSTKRPNILFSYASEMWNFCKYLNTASLLYNVSSVFAFLRQIHHSKLFVRRQSQSLIA